jgi:hypothetical protein
MDNEELLLNTLCDKYGSDKGSLVKTEGSHVYNWTPHNYTKIYAQLFKDIKNDRLNLFECGIGTNNINLESNMGINGMPGASLRVWKDYFVNSKIYGADIDKDILFEEERIKTGYIDQLDKKSVNNFFNDFGNFVPNIIIDDGLHTYKAGVSLFEATFDKLIDQGIYVIEDVNNDSFNKFQKYFNNFEYFVDFIRLEIEYGHKDDNNLIVIKKEKVKNG